MASDFLSQSWAHQHMLWIFLPVNQRLVHATPGVVRIIFYFPWCNIKFSKPFGSKLFLGITCVFKNKNCGYHSAYHIAFISMMLSAITILDENIAEIGQQEFSKWLLKFRNRTKSMPEWTTILSCFHWYENQKIPHERIVNWLFWYEKWWNAKRIIKVFLSQ